MAIEVVLSRLHGVMACGPHAWRAICPAHESHGSKSLKLAEPEPGKVLMHCFAGCETREILDALGLDFSALFETSLEFHPGRPINHSALFRTIHDELLVVSLAMSDLSNGRIPSAVDRERLKLAQKRIQESITSLSSIKDL